MNFRRIKDLRVDSDLKQDAVAKILNITRQQYGLYELGKRTIPIDLLIKLSKFYNVSLDYLTNLSDVKNIK